MIELSGLTAIEKRAYLIADNKLALNAGWNEGLLALEIADLVSLGVELDAAGFQAAELDKLLAVHGLGQASSFPDEAPAPPAHPVTRPGDVWLLGEHRLLCGDATSQADVGRVLAGQTAAMVFTDPPYNVAYEGKTASRMKLANDALGAKFGAFLEASCRNMLQACNGALYICMSSSELGTLRSAFESAGGRWSTFVVWSKSSFTLGRSDYQRQYEPILYGWRKDARRYWCGARDQSDVWEFARPARNDLHPTMKPVALVERALRNSSKAGETVLDPFAGSGTTLMAAEATGRHAALIELDARYCDVIIHRYQSTTSRAVRLEQSKKSFKETAAARGRKK